MLVLLSFQHTVKSNELDKDVHMCLPTDCTEHIRSAFSTFMSFAPLTDSSKPSMSHK